MMGCWSGVSACILCCILNYQTLLKCSYKCRLLIDFSLTVKALEAISTKLKIPNWSINENFCSDVGRINSSNNSDDNILINITCDCSQENHTVCSIINMYDPFSLILHIFINKHAPKYYT
jgi:hypothetical protein